MAAFLEDDPGHAWCNRDWVLAGIYAVSLLAAYGSLHGIYRPENLDDAWFLSFAHNFVVHGVEADTVFGTEPGGGGYGGVMLFGKTYSYLYGHGLNLIGWTKSHAHLISIGCAVLGAACWVGILIQLTFSLRLSAFFGLGLLLTEPLFGAANQARPDALSFLIISTALLLFVHRKYAWAGFLAAVAWEIHPVGIVVFFFMASVMIARRPLRKPRAVFWCAAGFGIGMLCYRVLHVQHLDLLPQVLLQGNRGGEGVHSLLYAYFFQTRYYRHLPELVVLSGCVAVFVFKRHYHQDALVGVLVLAALLFALLIRRPNFMYTVYIYPAFLLLFLRVFERLRRVGMAAVLLLVYLLPQYAFVYLKNRHWDMGAYVDQVRALVPEGDAPVVGGPNDWFAFLDRPFYAVDYRGDMAAQAPREMVLIEHDAYRHNAYPRVKSVCDEGYRATECGRFASLGDTVVVKRLSAAP